MAKSSIPPASSIPADLDQSQEECDEHESESMTGQNQEEEIKILETDQPPSMK